MHRIDGPGATVGNLFTDGDPTAGTPATIVTDTWANAVQEELAGVIEGAGIALSKPNNGQLAAAISKLLKLRLPAGAVQAFAMAAVPTGWLACNGQVVSRAAYADLFAAIGTLYGAGDGATTFGLPELRGEFLRGWDNGRGVDAGRGIGTAQGEELKAHTHTMGAEAGGGSNLATAVDSSGVDETAAGNPTGSTGGAETRPRNVAVLYCIRT